MHKNPIKETISLFNKAVSSGNTLNVITRNEVIAKAFKIGYIIHPDLLTSDINDYISKEYLSQKKPSSIFYKSWEKAEAEGDTIQRVVDQILHYLSDGELLLSGGDISLLDIPFSEFKFITPISKEELETKSVVLLQGTALKQDTIQNLLNVFKYLERYPRIDNIKNNEAKAMFAKELGLFPSNGDDIVRTLVYLATNKTMVIKNKTTIQAIKSSKVSLEKLTHINLVNLSKCFYRYKDILLAFKSCSKANKPIINKIRKLAIKNHTPIKANIWETIISNEQSIQKVLDNNMLKDLPSLKLVKLSKAIDQSLLGLNNRIFIIRNGSIFGKEGKPKTANALILSRLQQNIVSILKERVNNKFEELNIKKIYIPENFFVGLPKSEKTFLGNIPYGSYYNFKDLQDDLVVGIEWEGNQARDMDLSLILSSNGENKRIGWGASHYTHPQYKIAFSGDVVGVHGDNKGIELFKASKETIACINVNTFSGVSENPSYSFILGTAQTIKKNTMMDNLMFRIDGVKNTKAEQAVAVIGNNKLILCPVFTSNSRVSDIDSITSIYRDYIIASAEYAITFNQLIPDNVIITSDNTEEGVDLRLDPTNLSTDSVLQFLV